MASSNSVVVKFLADTSQMNKGIQKVNGQLSGFATAAKGIGVAIAGAFAVGKIADFGREVIDLASQMEQAAGATETLFGSGAAQKIDDWAKTTADAFGISSVAATEAANTFSVAGKAIGLSGDDLVDFSTNLVGISADLGAAFGDTEGAIRAIGSALRGEFDPLERYGIQLNATTLEAYAFEKGITTAYSSLDNATKQGLIAQYIQDQTDLLGITGQNAREQDTYAGKLARVQANFQDLQIAVGEKLLPVMVKLLDVALDLVNGFGALIDFLERFEGVIKDISIVVGVFTIAIVANKVAMTGASVATGIYSAAVLGLVRVIDLASAAQARFNAFVRANPYVIAATAIAGYIIWLKNLRGELRDVAEDTDNLIDLSKKQFKSWEDFLFFAPNAAAVAFVEIEKNWKNLTDSFEDGAKVQASAAERAAWDTEGHWSDANGNIVGSTYGTANAIADAYTKAANVAISAANATRAAWVAGQNAANVAVSGTVLSAISTAGFEDARNGFNRTFDEIITPAIENAFEKGGKSGGSKAREEAEKELVKIGKGWTGEFSFIDVYVGKRLQNVNSQLATEYQSRLSALREAQVNYEQVVTESVERVAEKLEETKKQMSETFLGFNLDDFVKVQEDGTTIFDSEAFDNYINDKNALATRLGGVVGQIPNLWIEQIAGMGPEAANATLDYLLGTDGNVSTQGTNAISKYQTLADNVYTNLSTPYAETMRKVYEEAEGAGILAAKKKVEDEAESFKEWSKKKLKHSIPVSVVYKADFSQAGPAYNGGSRSASYTIRNIQDYERLNGTKWRDRVR